MRTFAVLATFAYAATFASCSKGGDEKEVETPIEIPNESQQTQTAHADETVAGSVTFTAKSAWTAAVIETTAGRGALPWLRLMVGGQESYSGPAGTVNATIELDPNYTGAERSARITLSAGGGASVPVSVTQAATTQNGEVPQRPAITVGQQQGKLTAGSAGSATFAVTTTGIANGTTGEVLWLHENSTMSAELPAGIASATVSPVQNNAASVTITTTGSVEAGSAPFTVKIGGTTSSQSATLSVDEQPNTSPYDFYIGGTIYAPEETSLNTTELGNSSYTKNGEQINLPFRMIDFAVSGNDVHAVGYRRESDNGVELQRVYYWKNGQESALPVTQRNNWVTGIRVVGSDVYISGYEEIPEPNTSPPSSKFVAKYWKNNVIYTLGNAIENSFAFDIEVVGSDIYVLGRIGRLRTYEGNGYWKNGTFTSINAAHPIPEVYWFNDFEVSGQDVHIVGVGGTPVGGGKVSQDPVYWKNGVPQYLDPNIFSGYRPGGTAIAVSGEDVYIVSGIERTEEHASMWKNGEVTTIGDGWAYDVKVVDGDVYVLVDVTDPGMQYHHDIYRNGVKIHTFPQTSAWVRSPRRLIIVPKSPVRSW